MSSRSTGLNTFFPTYYTVTWNGTTPTNYNALTGLQAGGVDCATSRDVQGQVWLVGTVSNPTVTVNNSIVINGVEVVFTGTSLASVVAEINKLTPKSGLVADSTSFSGYLTISNFISAGAGYGITVSAGNGTAISDLGLTNNEIWPHFPNMVGSTWSSPSNGNTILINGVTVTFTSAQGLNPAGVAASINTGITQHNVVARASAAGLQLASVNGQAFLLADGTAGTLAKMGFSAGVQVGPVGTLSNSITKTLANMRWNQVLQDLSNITSPSFLGWVNRTSTVGSIAPVSQISFSVAYDRPDYLQIADELNSGATLTGENAIKRVVAKSLCASPLPSNKMVFDPTATTFHTSHPNMANLNQIINMEVLGLDTSITAVEANITVVKNTTAVSNI